MLGQIVAHRLRLWHKYELALRKLLDVCALPVTSRVSLHPVECEMAYQALRKMACQQQQFAQWVGYAIRPASCEGRQQQVIGVTLEMFQAGIFSRLGLQ